MHLQSIATNVLLDQMNESLHCLTGLLTIQADHGRLQAYVCKALIDLTCRHLTTTSVLFESSQRVRRRLPCLIVIICHCNFVFLKSILLLLIKIFWNILFWYFFFFLLSDLLKYYFLFSFFFFFLSIIYKKKDFSL